ncbi:hypothetical protein CK203_040943 [Vitis vinifera]|uniref:Uncharacterized protein n=1 Tax=Vitis vinifera TaxID=29760 RepID=A0A438HV70_VITVI|nr:hypothetical protein CK203_040943 [Vitis vinifera]
MRRFLRAYYTLEEKVPTSIPAVLLTEMNSKEYLEQHAAMLAEKQLSQDDGDEKALQA